MSGQYAINARRRISPDASMAACASIHTARNLGDRDQPIVRIWPEAKTKAELYFGCAEIDRLRADWNDRVEKSETVRLIRRRRQCRCWSRIYSLAPITGLRVSEWRSAVYDRDAAERHWEAAAGALSPVYSSRKPALDALSSTIRPFRSSIPSPIAIGPISRVRCSYALALYRRHRIGGVSTPASADQ